MTSQKNAGIIANKDIPDRLKPPYPTVIIGMKRSGHHAIIQWLCSQAPHEILHANDCRIKIDSSGEFHMRVNREVVYNKHQGKSETWPSFENTQFRKLKQLSRGNFHRVFVITRDMYNMVASCRAGLQGAQGHEFDSPLYKRIIKIYSTYLRESLNPMSQIECDTLTPVSYNRWFSSEEYRRNLAAISGYKFTDSLFNKIAPYGTRSSFLPNSITDASQLAPLSRWEHYKDDKNFVELFQDQDLINATEEFHGFKYPF